MSSPLPGPSNGGPPGQAPFHQESPHLGSGSSTPHSGRFFSRLLRDDSFTSLQRAVSRRLFASRLATFREASVYAEDEWRPANSSEGDRLPGGGYEDRTIVDWAHEHRKERSRTEQLGAVAGLRGVGYRLLDMMAPWWVIVATGVTVGLLAGCLDVLVDWLGDLRMGRCSYAFHLDKASCCSGLDIDEVCHEWRTWGEVLHVPFRPVKAFVQYLIYIIFSVTLAGTAAFLVRSFAPFAFHTGIPEMKTIVSGYIIKGYLSPWTLVIKALGLALAVASGLCLGKEGPLVHVACSVGHIFLRSVRVFRDNEARKREFLSAAAAAGVSVAFGAPLGGVLFVLEEFHLTSLPQATLWRSFVCAIVATVTLQYFDPYKSGKLVLFQVQSVGQVWRGFELVPWVGLGVAGGVFGAVFIRANVECAKIRRTSDLARYPVSETLAVAGFTALLSYLIPFMRVPMSELVETLFGDCASGDVLGVCDSSHAFAVVFLLLVTAAAKAVLTAVTFGIAVPAGIFMPTIAVGACVGRAVGIIMSSWQQAYPRLWLFAACPPEGLCISPPVYAVIGAASAVGGMTRMTISLVVIMFELTGAIELVLQIMLAVMTAKFTADYFSRDGIYEAWINFRGYPHLSLKMDYRRDNVLARHIMTTDVVKLPAQAATLNMLEARLKRHHFKGYPIVKSDDNPELVGYVPDSELRFALALARKRSASNASALCDFIGSPNRASFETEDSTDDSQEAETIELGRWVDQAPIVLSPDVPMEVVVQCFQHLGLRYVLFTQHGMLCGLLTKRDVHKHIRAPYYSTARRGLGADATSNPEYEAVAPQETRGLTDSTVELPRL